MINMLIIKKLIISIQIIIRKVDEKVANSIKEIKETVKAIKEVSNDIESKKIISNVLIGAGVVGLLIKIDMIIN